MVARSEIALRAGQVPAIEPVHPREVGPVRLERLAGGPGQAEREVGGRAGKVEQLGGQLVEQRAGVLAARSSTRATLIRAPLATSYTRAARWSESPARAKSPSTTVHTPASRARRRAMSRPMSSRRPQVVAAQEVVQPLVVHHGEIVPLGQVEPQHADAAVAQPLDDRIVAEVVERQHQDRVPRIDAFRRALGAPHQADGRRQHRQQRCPRPPASRSAGSLDAAAWRARRPRPAATPRPSATARRAASPAPS